MVIVTGIVFGIGGLIQMLVGNDIAAHIGFLTMMLCYCTKDVCDVLRKK